MAGGNVPTGLAPVFAQAGAQFHIPPAVLAGIASVETNLGQNKNTSATGARGVMQFEPGTAKGLGVNVNDPRSEIFGAAKLLNQYGYQSNPTRAIGAYNGGPGNPQMGYARQVLSEANRLHGQLTGSSSGLPSLSLGGGGAAGSTTRSVTSQVFDAKAFAAAQAKATAGNFIAKNDAYDAKSDPYATGLPKTGLATGRGAESSLLAAGLTTTQPNPADYQKAQTTLENVAGGTLNQHPAAFGASLKGSGYTNPLPGATWGRTDMGVDASMKNGAAIHALGDSRVVNIFPNWYAGQPYVQLQLTSGPQAGKYYYVAEAINPTVKPGQAVRAGQTIGTYNGGGTGLELGWGTKTQATLAQATGNTGDASHGNAPAGQSFRNFLNGIGAHAG